MAFNTAEGAGEFAKKEKSRFYRMALRSATESSSIIDVIFGFGFIGSDLYDQADHMLDRIIAMLTKLVQRHGEMAVVSEISSDRHDADRQNR